MLKGRVVVASFAENREVARISHPRLPKGLQQLLGAGDGLVEVGPILGRFAVKRPLVAQVDVHPRHSTQRREHRSAENVAG